MKQTPEFKYSGDGPVWSDVPDWGLVDRDWGNDDVVVWLDPEVDKLPSGSTSSSRSGLDTRTGLPVVTTEFRQPDGQLESRSRTSIDQFGHRVVCGEHYRSDGSLELKSYVCTNPRTGHLIAEYRAYRPDGSLDRWDRNYFDKDGNSVAENRTYGRSGRPLGESRWVTNPWTGRRVEQTF